MSGQARREFRFVERAEEADQRAPRGQRIDLVSALRPVSARTLLIAFSSDWLYPPWGSEELAAALLLAPPSTERESFSSSMHRQHRFRSDP